MSSIPHLIMAMIGLIVLFIIMCIRNEEKDRLDSEEKDTESIRREFERRKYLEQRDIITRESEARIAMYQKRIDDYKNTVENNEWIFEEIDMVIDTHKEMTNAVNFTQELINQGL